MNAGQHAESAEVWTYEADHHVDMQGADIFHHIVAGERHVAEVSTEADARRILHALTVVSRVESLAENVERKATEDRAKIEQGGLWLGQIEALERRAQNYDLVADGLRRALSDVVLSPGQRAGEGRS